MNAADFVAGKRERDEVGGCVQRNSSVIDKHCGLLIDHARTEYPPCSGGISTVVLANLALASFLENPNEIELDVLSQHRADGIKISGLKTFDIDDEAKPHFLR